MDEENKTENHKKNSHKVGKIDDYVECEECGRNFKISEIFGKCQKDKKYVCKGCGKACDNCNKVYTKEYLTKENGKNLCDRCLTPITNSSGGGGLVFFFIVIIIIIVLVILYVTNPYIFY